MGITLDDGAQAASVPSIQFQKEGDTVVFGVVNVEELQSFSRDKDGEKELHYWDKAQTEPKMMKVITGLVITGDVNKKDGDGEAVVKPGDIVSLWASGQRWTAWHDMVKKLGKIEVGDVVQWKLTELAKNKTPGWSDVKVCSIVGRKPKAEDGDLADRCVAAYHASKDRPAVDDAPMTAEDVADAFGADSDPF